MLPEQIHLAVVGAGPIGLETAAWAKWRGYQVTILEKQASVGGDWLQWGNPWSKLQSHRDSYLFSGPVAVPGEEQLPSYPSLDSMLRYFQAYADAAGISQHVKFNCTVVGRGTVQSNGKLTICFSEKDVGAQTLEVTHIFVAPGRVNKRRQVRVPGELKFRGQVAMGSGGDLMGQSLFGKNVVIIGHGSFAIENARHALEQGAASVTMVARRKQLVMSRAAGLFVDRNVDRNMPATAVLAALRNMYRLIDGGDDELEGLFYSPSKTMFPTSDVYFLARAAKKLAVEIGTIVRFGERGVETCDGRSIPADIVIKCTGFTHDAAFDAAMKADAKKGGRVTNVHHVDVRKTQGRNTFFVGGTGGYRHISPCYDCIAQIESLPNSDLAASKNLLRQRVANRSRTNQCLKQFLVEQETEWLNYCTILGADIRYPYTVHDMLAWEDTLLNSERLLDKRCDDSGIAFNTIDHTFECELAE